MADSIAYEDIVRLAGRRGIVDREWSQYPARPGRHLILGFNSEGGGWAWAEAKDVEKLSTEFLGMPNEEHAPEPGQPLTLWQQIPHGFDSYLWPDSWDRCMYCGLSQAGEIHIPDEG
ncbi:hypothetical protein [Streptomyces sp. NPDC059080]|uniref:hypothetical protein n=1 Tax=Streptomyces sp. NPDC059080 TaxID=3346718 RepID=UPI0036CB4B76